jgi:hypothetical protein
MPTDPRTRICFIGIPVTTCDDETILLLAREGVVL